MALLASSGTARLTSADLTLTAVTKRYGEAGAVIRAVDDVSLAVPAGATVAVQGASGSGKSTLLQLMASIERPDSGQVRVGGLDLMSLSRRELSAYRRQVGIVFQQFQLLPALTTLDNVLVPLLGQRRAPRRRERAQEALRRVGLGDREAALPAELSGGEQQRVAIARAIVGQPRLLLADEPTGNLDSRTTHDIMALLTRVRHELDATLVVVTHDREVAGYCDRIVELRDGRLA